MHFGQNGLLHFNQRPFPNAQEMDEVLIQNWNKVVPTDGLVFVLGDIGENTDDRIIHIFRTLNGQKILIKGNHDTYYKQEILQTIFTQIHNLHEIQIADPHTHQYQKIVLCHYPMFDWNNFFEGSWQLFGHLHTRNITEFKTLKTKLFAQQYDVGVDANNFTPLSYTQVKNIIHKQIEDKTFKQSNYY